MQVIVGIVILLGMALLIKGFVRVEGRKGIIPFLYLLGIFLYVFAAMFIALFLY